MVPARVGALLLKPMSIDRMAGGDLLRCDNVNLRQRPPGMRQT
jgi:hypothetical protein